jgi:hypothetical protein
LQSDYVAGTNNFVTLQTYANLIEEQINLDLPVDSGLAYQIATYQTQIKSTINTYVSDQAVPSYVDLLSKASNFYALWQAVYQLETPNLKNAYADQGARGNTAQAISILAIQSGQINQSATAFASDFTVTNGNLDNLNASFNTALTAAIAELGTDATNASSNIDQLNAAITNNINDIVAGANKVGSSVSELLIGLLTTITDAKADSEKKDTPSTNFVVSAIKGAEDGIAETAQARADLNANNTKLITAYQSLAQYNALVAVAKVVQIQNTLFTTALSNALASVQQIANTWGQSPQMPPSSGVSLEFSNFVDAVKGIVSQSDADTLAGQMDYAATAWDLFNQQLLIQRQILTGWNSTT